MRKSIYYLSIGVLLFTAACEDADDPVQDLNAPVIGPAEGRDDIRPRNEETTSTTSTHLHVRFSVEDPGGISQIRVNIHSGFDGHTHGRVTTDFERLSVDDIYAPDASSPDFRFPQGATKVNIDDHATDVFWEGAESRTQLPVLAGPYHFSIQATDLSGNQTSYADDSNYSAIFYLRTAYAPQVEITNLHDGDVEGAPGQPLELNGFIQKATHALSSDLKFVWIRVGEEHEDDHDHHHARVSDEGHHYEKMWGTSTWRDGFTGPDLPSKSKVNLNELLSGENTIVLPSDEDHLDLIIWVEDTAGNITRDTYHIHAH